MDSEQTRETRCPCCGLFPRCPMCGERRGATPPAVPSPSADEQAVIAGLERVRAFVRSWWNRAECQCDGVKHYSCPLCDVDRALALLRARGRK
jgi:hypothetical protein